MTQKHLLGVIAAIVLLAGCAHQQTPIEASCEQLCDGWAATEHALMPVSIYDARSRICACWSRREKFETPREEAASFIRAR